MPAVPIIEGGIPSMGGGCIVAGGCMVGGGFAGGCIVVGGCMAGGWFTPGVIPVGAGGFPGVEVPPLGGMGSSVCFGGAEVVPSSWQPATVEVTPTPTTDLLRNLRRVKSLMLPPRNGFGARLID
jgi:hypothetical protein